MTFDDLVEQAKKRATRAMDRYPAPNYTLTKFAEEAGEVVKEGIHLAEGRSTPERLVDEMTDALAMLYRLWMEGDGVHGLPAISIAIATSQAGQK